MGWLSIREPSGGAQRVSGGQGGTGGDIRADYPAEAGTFAAREFTREGSSHCQEWTIVVRPVPLTRAAPDGTERARMSGIVHRAIDVECMYVSDRLPVMQPS